MAQPTRSPELVPALDSSVKTHYWLGPIVIEESGRIIRSVYESNIDPLTLSEREVANIQPVAAVIITLPQEKAQYPDAPAYMTHIPGPGSRQERQKLQQIIADLDPLSTVGSLPQPRDS